MKLLRVMSRNNKIYNILFIKYIMRWLKVCSISVFVLLFLSVLMIGLTIYNNSRDSENTTLTTISSALWILVIILILVAFTGFAKIGKHAESKMLQLSSWALFGLILVLILIIAMASFTNIGEPTFLGVLVLVLLIATLASFSLFSIGLIDISNEIKFVRILGITDILILVLGPFILVFSSIFSLAGAVTNSFSGETSSLSTLSSIFLYIIILAILATIALMALTLGDASNKFESSLLPQQMFNPQGQSMISGNNPLMRQ